MASSVSSSSGILFRLSILVHCMRRGTIAHGLEAVSVPLYLELGLFACASPHSDTSFLAYYW